VRSCPLIKIPSKAKDTGHPNAYKNGLRFILKKKPDAYTEDKAEKRCNNEEIPAFRFHFLSFGV
jgi:hypothetical protein